VGDGSEWQLAVRYVPWAPETGIPGALAAAHEHLADEPVLVGPGDALHRERLHPHIAAFADDRLDALALALAGAPRDERGNTLRGAYLLSRRGVSILLNGAGRSGDPLVGVQQHGGAVDVREVDGCLPCHGGQDGLLEGNRRMLEVVRRDVDAAAFTYCDFQGAVRVHPSARLDHTLVRGPAVIGPGSCLSHAYVGPWTSIGADVVITGSHVEHSIVFDGARIEHVEARIESSVIGREACVTRSFALPRSLRLSIADGAEITLS
jgi:glucose-1-phosphate thymidylyltransferase